MKSMINEIKKLDDFVFKPLNLDLSEIIQDPESEDYLGFNFRINDIKIKFRKSKLTPKKIGQFVTFWKRDQNKKTVPFDVEDDFDFYIILIEENENAGFFIFPKSILEKKDLISSQSKAGKRGFRIYSDWHFPTSKQAERSKLWQTRYFINFANTESSTLEKFETILNSKNQ